MGVPVQVPEAPQKRRSVRGFTHSLLQLTWPARHEVKHDPLLHTWPVAQAVPALLPVALVQLPRAPQKLRSVWGSTQRLLHTTCPVGHTKVQTPARHDWPAEHTAPAAAPEQAPEAPQKRSSVCGSMHALPQRT